MALRKPIQILIEAKDKTARAFRSVNDKFSELIASAKSFTAIGIAAAATTGAAALTRLAQSVDRVAKDASRLNLAAAELQKLQFAAEQTGFSADQLTTAIQRMVRRISEAAAGTGVAKKAIEELGLVAADLNQLAPDEQFKRIADALQDVGNSGDKTRLVVNLFDQEAAKLVNTLEGGREAINAYGKEFEALGATFSGESAVGAKILLDGLNKLKNGVKGVASQALAGVSAIKQFTDAIRFLVTGSLNTGDSLKNEFLEIKFAVESITEELINLKAEGSIGDGLFPVDVSNRIAELESQLRDHKERLVELLKSEGEKNELKRREAAERQHNREMAAARDEQTKALEIELRNREALQAANLAESKRFAQEQAALTAEINSLLSGIGTGNESVERIDVLRKSVEAWDELAEGNFAEVLALVKDGLGLLSEYEGEGGKSAAEIITLKDAFAELAEAAGTAQKQDLAKGVQAGKQQFEELKKEIESKPATVIVRPDSSSGKNVHVGTQALLNQEGPVVVDVALNITGVASGEAPAANGDESLVSEVETQSDKRGHRL